MPGYTPYYGNYMPNYYQPMQNYQPIPMNQPSMPQNNQPQFQAQTQAPQTMPTNQPGIIWVPSEQAANEYLVAPNNAVALWDSNNPVIYMKQADASGKPSMKIYDLVERAQRPVQAPTAPLVEYAPLSRLEALEARLDALSTAKTASKKTAPKEDVNDG